jgi:hypothetical protein
MGIAVLRAEHNDDIRLLAIGKLNRLIQHHKAEAVAFDAWFGFQPRDTLQQLLQHAGVEKVLEVWNHISPELAVSRYASRLQDRKPGHPGEEYLPELAQLAQQAEPMRLGPVFTVDQHKPLDMASATRWIETQIA